jgi:hypothetical protein
MIQLDGLQFFQEFRFMPPSGGVTRLQLTLTMPPFPNPRLSLGELFFMEQTAEPEKPLPSFETCLAALRTHRVNRLYAPRWVEEGIVANSVTGIDVPQPASLTRSVQDEAECESTRPIPILFKGTTGLLTDGHDTDRTRAVLKDAGLRWREVELDSYALFVVTEADRDAPSLLAPLFWTELGCLTERFSRPQALAWFRKAADHAARGEESARLDCLRNAAQAYPSWLPAREAWIEALRSGGQTAEATIQAALLKQDTVPEIPAAIRFSNGVEFLGLTLSSTEAAPGQALDVSYYWKWPARPLSKQPIAFVHWEQAGRRFQEDHGLLGAEWPDDPLRQPLDEIVREQRRFTVPANALPGEYRLIIGLLSPDGIRRLRAETVLDQRRRAVTCPATLKVRSVP